MADMLTPGRIYQWLKDPQTLVPKTIKPNYQLTDADAMAITADLMSIRE